MLVVRRFHSLSDAVMSQRKNKKRRRKQRPTEGLCQHGMGSGGKVE